VHLGGYAAGPFGVASGPLPGVPLLTALPTHGAQWFTAALVVPLVVGLLVGWYTRDADSVPQYRVRMVAIAAGVVATGMFVLAAASGGRLGAATFDPVTVPAGAAAMTWFGWMFVPGAVMTWLAGSREAAGPPIPGLLDEEFEDELDESEMDSGESGETVVTAEQDEEEPAAQTESEDLELPQPADGSHDHQVTKDPVEKID
jgi:hypothetical protein